MRMSRTEIGAADPSETARAYHLVVPSRFVHDKPRTGPPTSGYRRWRAINWCSSCGNLAKVESCVARQVAVRVIDGESSICGNVPGIRIAELERRLGHDMSLVSRLAS
jgi:hypothetical protein